MHYKFMYPLMKSFFFGIDLAIWSPSILQAPLKENVNNTIDVIPENLPDNFWW